MTKAKRRLTDIQVHEISFVDKAANKRQFVVLKADQDFFEKVEKAISDCDQDQLKQFVEGVDSIEGDTYDLEEVKKFFPMPFMNQGLMNPFMAPDFQTLALMQQMADFVRQSLLSQSNNVDQSENTGNLVGNNFITDNDRRNSFVPEPEMIDKKEGLEMTQEEIQKAIDDRVAEALAKAEQDKQAAVEAAIAESNAKLEVMAKALEDQRAKQFIEKAEKLSVLGVDAEFGKVLKALADADAENYAQVEAVLVKAADTLNNIDLTQETGSEVAVDAEGIESVDDLVNARADAILKANESLSRPQAIVKALDELVSEGKIS